MAWDKLAAFVPSLKQGAHLLTPFHWEIEFPEVFARENGGFDAIVGNPPFLAGRSVWPTFGGAYRDLLREFYEGTGGKAVDLVAYFFRRAFSLVRNGGAFVSSLRIRLGKATPVWRDLGIFGGTWLDFCGYEANEVAG